MLARNLAFNITGQLAPLATAALAVPYLIHGMGTERFGLLTIAWMFIGYFGIFDLGLGRAMTRVVATRIGTDDEHEIPQLVWTGLVMMFGLGSLGGGALALAAEWITHSLLDIPPALRGEAESSFRLLALSLPAVILTTGLRGVAEAYGRFDLTNLIRIPTGLWTFLGPLLTLPWSVRLEHVVATLLAGRIVTTALHAYALERSAPSVFSQRRVSVQQARQMLSFGGWMAVSNFVSPAMVYMDRFVIGSLLGVAAVAYYTTPFEIVFKLNFFPEAVFGVLFPLMSSKLSRGSADDTKTFYALANKLMVAVMFPLTLLIVLGAHDFLRLWLSPDFAERSTFVLQVFAIGLCCNSLSKVAFNLLQAKGRPDVTAWLHVLELPIYVVTLWVLASRFGIEGAALAWAGRMLLDFGLLTAASLHFAQLPLSALAAQLRNLLLIGVLFACALPLTSAVSKGIYLAVSGPLFVFIFWTSILSSADRNTILEAIRLRVLRKSALPSERAP